MTRPSREELIDRILIHIAKASWDDVTGMFGTDETAIQSLAASFDTRLQQLYILSRYEDGGAEFSLVSFNATSAKSKRVTADQERLKRLWDRVIPN